MHLTPLHTQYTFVQCVCVLLVHNPVNTKHLYNIYTMLDQRPTLYKCYTNALCLLGCARVILSVRSAKYFFQYFKRLQFTIDVIATNTRSYVDLMVAQRWADIIPTLAYPL